MLACPTCRPAQLGKPRSLPTVLSTCQICSTPCHPPDANDNDDDEVVDYDDDDGVDDDDEEANANASYTRVIRPPCTLITGWETSQDN